MDDTKVGALARAIRHRLGWTQRQLGDRIGLSQQLISLFERGHLDDLTVRTARRIGAALEISLAFEPRWRGGEGARLLDADHSALANAIVTLLRAAGWEVTVEYTFNHFGERGSIDIIGWHAASQCLLIVEVKSRLLDTQATLATLDRKVRVVPMLLARERGWTAKSVGVVLAMPGLTANRSAVTRHAATFASAFPDRAPEVRRWLRRPAGRLAAVWFLSNTHGGSATQARATRRRVRPTPPRPPLRGPHP
jgi:transcriptional regulator with XRE-family HTH domain